MMFQNRPNKGKKPVFQKKDGNKNKSDQKPSMRMEMIREQAKAASDTLATFNKFLSYGKKTHVENPLFTMKLDDILKVDQG